MHGSARLAVYALVSLVVGAGCTRKFFREMADKDVAGVITQKNVFPDWAVKNWHVYPDPRSRFADPFNPDRPPYPPDDYAARLLSPNPQHPTKRTGTGRFDGEGYLTLLRQWDAANRAEDAAAAATATARGAPPERIVMPRPAFSPASPRSDQSPRSPGSAQPPDPGSDRVWQSRPASTLVEKLPDLERSPDPLPPADGSAGPVGSNESAGPDAPSRTSEWVRSRPRVVVGPPTPQPGPRVTEVRSSLDPVASLSAARNESDLNELAVPGFAVRPEPPPPANRVPERLPPPKPYDPRPDDPKAGDAGKAGDAAKAGDAGKAGDTPGSLPSIPALIAAAGGSDDYLRALASNEQGYRIKAEQAVELGLINSREFQDRREDLYLAALPVTLERFSFAAQAFFTEQVIRDFTGSQLTDAGRFWRADTRAGLGKRFVTGGALLTSFANQVVIQLGSNRPDIALSTLSLSLVQPLLRGGGLAVTLEELTQAERNLLYAIRSYARFRKVFYVAIGAGGGYTNNPYGLQGLSVNLGRGVGNNLTAPSVGFLPLLQQAAVIANQRKNVGFLERLLRQYQAYGEGGQLSDLQIGQVEVQLLNSRGNLINGGGGVTGIRQYLDALDNFKLQLGLPLTVGLDLDPGPLKPVRQQIGRFEDVYGQLRRLALEAGKFDPAEAPGQLRDRWRRYLTESELVKGTAFARGISSRWDAVAKLSNPELAARIAELTRRRSELLDRRADRRLNNQPEPQAEARAIREVEAELELANFERLLRNYESQPWLKEKGPAQGAAREAAFRASFNALLQLVLEARNERLTETRKLWPRLAALRVGPTDLLTADLDTAYTEGIRAALTNRLDLMNARALVVDAYRQIAVLANSLQGVFDVNYDASTLTPPGDNRPFAFDTRRSRQQLTFRAELPLVRRAERNQYRAALIAYQRQRRTLMAFEDNIANDVRSGVRQLRTLAELYKIQQRVVELGYSQVDSAQETLFAPLAAGQTLDAAASAALTQQLLQAQSSLLNAQNALITTWVNYLIARMNLYLDLELMQIDERGVWIDEYATGTDDPPRPEPGRPEWLPPPAPLDPARNRDGQAAPGPTGQTAPPSRPRGRPGRPRCPGRRRPGRTLPV